MDNKIEKIYHYTTIKKADLILSGMKLKLGTLDKTNDPKENHDFTFSIQFDSNKDGNKTWKEASEYYSPLLRKDCKLLCFSVNSNDMFGYGYSRLWDHYAGKHKGVCLEFDKSKFEIYNKDVVKKKYFNKIKYNGLELLKYNRRKMIDYIEMKKTGEAAYIKKFKHKYLKYLYFTKTKEWESENELRLINFSNTPIYCNIENSLVCIYKGLKYKKEKNKIDLEDKYPHLCFKNLNFKEGIMTPKL